ncbi:MAG: outer membrane protein assembly factor BamE [Akkermansiaceae bacterium]|nr:outer membrane protein assembly factor BamE [Verrucomicrobiales bacterium]
MNVTDFHYSFQSMNTTSNRLSAKKLHCAAAFIGALLLISIQCGCTTPARLLDRETVMGQLQKGQTPAQVRQILGTPAYSETGANNKTMDVFIVQIPTLVEVGRMASLEVRSVFVRYDGAGKAEKFSHHIGHAKGFAVARGEIWRAGRPLSMEKIRQIKPGETTKDEAIDLFGPPTIEGFDVYGLTLLRWIYAEGRDVSILRGQELLVRVDVEVVMDFAHRNLKP